MESKPNSEEKQQPKAQPQAQQRPEAEQTFAVDALIARAPEYLGVPRHVAAGAFASDEREEVTLKDAKSAIDEWLDKTVETEE